MLLSHDFAVVILTREPWPLDGLKFDTLKEQQAKRSPEDLEIDLGMSYKLHEYPFQNKYSRAPK